MLETWINSGTGLPGFKKNGNRNFIKHWFCALKKKQKILAQQQKIKVANENSFGN